MEVKENQYRMDSSSRLIFTRWVVKEKSIQDREVKKPDIYKMGLIKIHYRMDSARSMIFTRCG